MSERRPLPRVEGGDAAAAARALHVFWLTAARLPGTGGPPS